MADAYDYIAADSPIAAERWHRGIERAIASLSISPRRCQLAPESNESNCELRQHWYKSYRILFTINSQRVVVLHVRHGARDTMRPDEFAPPE